MYRRESPYAGTPREHIELSHETESYSSSTTRMLVTGRR